MNKRTTVLFVILIFSLLVLGYVKTHQSEINASLAYHYFKKNDMIQAQNYFERAFDFGDSKEKDRNIYVNSIINSPLNTDAQEKLVKFLEYPVEDTARQKALFFLDDLKKEIHRKYPDNYISHTTLNQQVVRWNDLPITYGFSNIEKAPIYFTREIESAFAAWELESDHKILFQREDNNPNIIIRYMEYNPADVKDKKYVVAYTVPTINGSNLVNMAINFYQYDPFGEYYSKNQVFNTALHEIAHALGFMGHCNEEENIMYLSKDSMSVVNDVRESLNFADINTITLLYDIKPDITNSTSRESKYIPYLVLGNEQEISKVKMREAMTYVKKAPGLPSGYIDLAEGYVASKNYSKAIRILEKALNVADTKEIEGIIYYNLAVCYFMLDNPSTALIYLDKSIEINDSIEKQHLLAEIYLKKEDKDKAIAKYEELINKDQRNIEYVIALTNIYVQDKNYKKVRSVLRSFLQKNPSEKNNPRFKSYGILMKFL